MYHVCMDGYNVHICMLEKCFGECVCVGGVLSELILFEKIEGEGYVLQFQKVQRLRGSSAFCISLLSFASLSLCLSLKLAIMGNEFFLLFHGSPQVRIISTPFLFFFCRVF